MILFAESERAWRSDCGRFEIEAEDQHGMTLFFVNVNGVPRHVEGDLQLAASWCQDQVVEQ